MLNVDMTEKDAASIIRYLDDCYWEYITGECYQSEEWGDDIRHIATAYIALCDVCRDGGYDPQYYEIVEKELAADMPIVRIHAGERIDAVCNRYKDVPNMWGRIQIVLNQNGLRVRPDGMIVEA